MVAGLGVPIFRVFTVYSFVLLSNGSLHIDLYQKVV